MMRMRLRHFLGILALAVHGCAADQMRVTAIRVAARVPEVYQTQIMDNLARTAANPGSMPYLSRLFNGTASSTDTASLVSSLTGQAHAFTSVNYGLSSLSRGVQANIGIDPIDNPDKLAAMQVAYRKVVAPRFRDSRNVRHLPRLPVKGYESLRRFPPAAGMAPDRMQADVPRGAATVAHCGATYVWVMPQDLDALTRFTYFILNVATVASQRQLATANVAPPAGTPTLTPREPTPGINFNLLLTPRP